MLNAKEMSLDLGSDLSLVDDSLNIYGNSIGDKANDLTLNKELILPDDILSSELSESLEPRLEPSNKIRIWQAKSGQTLKSVLLKWSQEENISLLWQAKEIYRLDYDVYISGTFKNAIDVLLSQGLTNSPSYDVRENPYSVIISDN